MYKHVREVWTGIVLSITFMVIVGVIAIIDPWGRVLAQQLDDCDAVLVADLDAQALLEARARIPTARHRLPPSRLAVQTVTLPT